MGYKVNLQNSQVEEELMSKLLELGLEIEMPEEDKEENKNNKIDNNNSKD